MKKIILVLAIASMVILDLILSGQSILVGLILLGAAALLSLSLDQASRQSRSELPSEAVQ